MFRQYRSHAWQWHTPELKTPVNTLEACEVEKIVSQLPSANRTALRWCYVFPWTPINAVRRELAVTRDGLAELVRDGRSMVQRALNHLLHEV